MTVEIQQYQPAYREAFRTLNEEWITHYFKLEAADEKVLGDPQLAIVARGGDILFAIEDGEVLGCCALVRQDAATCELAKMAVTPAAQGRHIGRLLGEAFLARARAMGFQQAFLETNAKLAPALGLYHSLGFKEAPFPHQSDYTRADVYMKLVL